MVEVSHLYNFTLALFWWYQFHSSTLYKNLDVVLIVVELLIKNFSSHFVLVPIKRLFDITDFFNSYSSEKIEWTSTGKSSSEETILFF